MFLTPEVISCVREVNSVYIFFKDASIQVNKCKI